MLELNFLYVAISWNNTELGLPVVLRDNVELRSVVLRIAMYRFLVIELSGMQFMK